MHSKPRGPKISASTSLRLRFVSSLRAAASCDVLVVIGPVLILTFGTTLLANLALAYFRADDFDSARETARKAARLDPAHALARQVLVATE